MSEELENEVTASAEIIDVENIQLEGASNRAGNEVVDLTKGYGPLLVDLTADEFNSPEVSRTRSGYRRSLRRKLEPQEGNGNHADMLQQQSDPGSSFSPSTASSDEKLVCPVCLENFEQIFRAQKQLVSTTCGHIFCDDCLKKAVRLQRKCPTCRQKLTSKQFHPLYI